MALSRSNGARKLTDSLVILITPPPKVTSLDVGHIPQGYDAVDCPPWLGPKLEATLGADFKPTLTAMQSRAPVFLRVNLARLTREAAMAGLAAEGIATKPVSWVHTALEVTDNARKVQTSEGYQTGLVELQDASSQAVVAGLYLTPQNLFRGQLQR